MARVLFVLLVLVALAAPLGAAPAEDGAPRDAIVALAPALQATTPPTAPACPHEAPAYAVVPPQPKVWTRLERPPQL